MSAIVLPPKFQRTARGLAFLALDEFHRTEAFVSDVLDRLFREVEPPAVERGLATALATGVVRRGATLDAIVTPHVTRQRHRVEGPLWTLLQLGAMQLVLLDGIPARAAVHETVELARAVQPRWTGFLNGVLRSVDRGRTDEVSAEPSSRAVPLCEERYRLLAEPTLPDPVERPNAWIAAAFGLPRWLVDRWAQRFDFAELVRLGFRFDAPPATTLRVNALRTTREELLAALADGGLSAGPGGRPESVRLDDRRPIESLPGFAAGWFSVQDESAMAAAELLDPRPGERVLDLCAAPGTKTTHLAERMRNEGTIVATDVDETRLERVRENAGRLGLTIVETRVVGDDPGSIPEGPFDAILVDVPCSNTGVLGKRPEVRHRLGPDDLVELPDVQSRLLIAAHDRLGPGGRIVYSTCSIEPEENRHVVEAVLRDRGDVELVREIEHVPGEPADGAYQALLRAR